MSSVPDPAITDLLSRAGAGDDLASSRLFEVVFAELRVIAGSAFRAAPANTLQPTVLVGDAWAKLVGHLGEMESRVHFYAVAAKAMRQVLADEARRRRSQKRGGGQRGVTLCDGDGLAPAAGYDLVDLSDSLERLRSLNERHADIVELRFFSGLTIAETAQAIGFSPDTVKDDWVMARAWLRRELGPA